MVYPTVRIDTAVKVGAATQAIKRASPVDEGEEEDMAPGMADNHDSRGSGEEVADSLPPFLCHSALDIHQKFEDLEWIQRTRIAEGMLTNDLSHRWALECDPEVKARNRYIGVQAWANSRIHLRVPEGECDFINASPITIRDRATQQERWYIATQGPKSKHISHFWQMVFHESKDVGVIVMLTQVFESGREKCAQYFPLDEDEPYMPLYSSTADPHAEDEDHQNADAASRLGTVELLECYFDSNSRSEVRKLQLTLGSQSKVVWHFLFAGWADFAKPEGEDREALLELIKLSASKCVSNSPRVVHCSAGVGRTGTFIALDHLLQELESGHLLAVSDPEIDPVFETVNRMREQRMMMVYNEIQLQFIYEVLRDQANKKLGRTVTTGSQDTPNEGPPKSSKMTQLSSESEQRLFPTSGLGYDYDTGFVPTPMRSWSGTPQVSDNE